MIDPFQHDTVKGGAISFGLSYFGYDLRLAKGVDVMQLPDQWQQGSIVDPKQFDRSLFLHNSGDTVLIPPNSFALGVSIEYFDIPRNIMALCLGKSTYARCGIITNFTPFEPGWKGYVTIEITNSTPYYVRIYPNEGIGQVLFFESEEAPLTGYEGEYQNQKGITGARVGKREPRTPESDGGGGEA